MEKARNKVKIGVETPFLIWDDGMIVIDKKIYLPDDKVFKDEVLNEAHESKFIVCPSSTKMYQDLKEFY